MKKNINFIGLYTGSNGRKGCTCDCAGCAQTRYGLENPNYQGTLEQIDKVIEELPNLNKVAIFGNPDISVDYEFCNQAAKKFIEKGIWVRFSTSGIGGKKVIDHLLDGIDPNYVEYINFSLDNLDLEKSKLLKGRKISLEKIKEGIISCVEHGVMPHIQPTVWEENKDDVKDVIDYSKNVLGVDYFSAHFGSLEGCSDDVILHHVNENDVKLIHDQMENMGVYIPKILLTEEEFYNTDYQNFITPCSNKASNILEIYLERDGIKATYCPLLTARHKEYIFDLEKSDLDAPLDEIHECPIKNETIGYELKKTKAICRYYPVLKS